MKSIMKKLNLFLAIAVLFTTVFATISFERIAKAYTKDNTSVADLAVINDFQGVADYIHKNGHLPSNYITKAKAKRLGWRPGEDLWEYAYGKSIGGDIFTNAERSLPDSPGRVWHECDINYNGGHRGADRILYSNDGLIYGTEDHYQTFTCYYN